MTKQKVTTPLSFLKARRYSVIGIIGFGLFQLLLGIYLLSLSLNDDITVAYTRHSNNNSKEGIINHNGRRNHNNNNYIPFFQRHLKGFHYNNNNKPLTTNSLATSNFSKKDDTALRPSQQLPPVENGDNNHYTAVQNTQQQKKDRGVKQPQNIVGNKNDIKEKSQSKNNSKEKSDNKKSKNNKNNKKDKIVKTAAAEVVLVKSTANDDDNDYIIPDIIQNEGKMYSFGRKDRSGSVITDMLYAHAYAYGHNLTYAGACFTLPKFPRPDTLHLIQKMDLTHILPFACPDGIGPELNILHPENEMKQLSSLILSRQTYRDIVGNKYFTDPWRKELQKNIGLIQDDTTTTKKANLRASDEQSNNNNKPFEIAVHIRRGDVTPCRYKRRYLTNEHYIQLIDQYTPKNNNNERPVHVTIFSESDTYESFDIFRKRNYQLELDTKDLSIVWKTLSTADVIILSRSYFSFVPAAINPNIVVATDFFEFQPLQHWHMADTKLTKQTDKTIRNMYNTQCNITEIEKQRQLEVSRHNQK